MVDFPWLCSPACIMFAPSPTAVAHHLQGINLWQLFCLGFRGETKKIPSKETLTFRVITIRAKKKNVTPAIRESYHPLHHLNPQPFQKGYPVAFCGSAEANNPLNPQTLETVGVGEEAKRWSGNPSISRLAYGSKAYLQCSKTWAASFAICPQKNAQQDIDWNLRIWGLFAGTPCEGFTYLFQESPKLYEELVGVGRPFLETTIYFFLLQESGEKDNLVRANKLMHLEAVAATFQVSSGLLIEEIHLSIRKLQFMPLFKT